MNAWVVHHNERVFGDEVKQFRPERWLKDDKGDKGQYCSRCAWEVI